MKQSKRMRWGRADGRGAARRDHQGKSTGGALELSAVGHRGSDGHVSVGIERIHVQRLTVAPQRRRKVPGARVGGAASHCLARPLPRDRRAEVRTQLLQRSRALLLLQSGKRNGRSRATCERRVQGPGQRAACCLEFSGALAEAGARQAGQCALHAAPVLVRHRVEAVRAAERGEGDVTGASAPAASCGNLKSSQQCRHPMRMAANAAMTRTSRTYGQTAAPGPRAALGRLRLRPHRRWIPHPVRLAIEPLRR